MPPFGNFKLEERLFCAAVLSLIVGLYYRIIWGFSKKKIQRAENKKEERKTEKT